MKYLFFLILPLGVFSQNLEIEKLVNQLVQDEIPADFEYFNLEDSSFNYSSVSPYDWFKKELKEIILEKQIKNLKVDDFSENKSDTKINWDQYNIERAKVNSFDNIPKFYSGYFTITFVPFDTPKVKLDSLYQYLNSVEIYVPVKRHWGYKRQNKEIKKSFDKRELLFNKEDREYYQISNPEFNSDKTFAIISLKPSQGGSYFLYKKENDNWIQIAEFSRWAY